MSAASMRCARVTPRVTNDAFTSFGRAGARGLGGGFGLGGGLGIERGLFAALGFRLGLPDGSNSSSDIESLRRFLNVGE